MVFPQGRQDNVFSPLLIQSRSEDDVHEVMRGGINDDIRTGRDGLATIMVLGWRLEQELGTEWNMTIEQTWSAAGTPSAHTLEATYSDGKCAFGNPTTLDR
jgi:hypothetical protein